MKRSTIVQQLAWAMMFLAGYFLLVSAAWAEENNPLTGMYRGYAQITSPAALGDLDLAFYLDVTGTAIVPETSYIDVGKTLVFPKVPPVIDGKEVGPRVTGVISPTAFTLATINIATANPLEAEVFTSTMGDKPVNRSITLTGNTIENGGNTLSGTYTETITGLKPNNEPVVVTGAFFLVKPIPVAEFEIKDANEDGCLDEEEVMAGGMDAHAMEYSDVSRAMHIYNDPSQLPNLCSETSMGDIISAYHNTLK